MQRYLTRDARKIQIMNVARQIAIIEGEGAVTAERIAAKLGVTRFLIHKYFGSVDNIRETLRTK